MHQLLTLYLSQLPDVLPKDAFVVSYADDTFVALKDKGKDLLKTKLELTMTAHSVFLRSTGMVTNVENTELIYFSRSRLEGPSTLSQQSNSDPLWICQGSWH